MKKYNSYIALLLLAFLLASAGCGGRTPQAKYYTLNPIEEPSEKTTSAQSPNSVSLGIGPIKFPDELERPSIVTRIGKNRLEVNEFRRWGGSLEKNFSRVMVENLSYLLQTDKVVARPWERYFQPDFRIAINVQQFSGRLGKFASLKATWMIFKNKTDLPLLVRKTSLQESVSANDYDAFVAAQSRVLAMLCQEITIALQDIQKRRQ